MTGIAHGTFNIPNISMGSTPILKVSMGDTLVWPDFVIIPDVFYVHAVADYTSTSATIPWPAAALEGDVIVFTERASGNPSSVVLEYPAGFTAITGKPVNPANTGIAASYRIVTAEDITNAAPISGFPNQTTNYQKIITVVRGADMFGFDTPITNVEVFQANSVTSTGEPPGTSLTDPNLIYSRTNCMTFGMYGANSAVDPRAWNNTASPPTKEVSASTLFYSKYRENGLRGDFPVVVAQTDEGTGNTSGGFILRFGPTGAMTTNIGLDGEYPVMIVGEFMEATLLAYGGTQPYTLDVVGGALPAGTTLYGQLDTFTIDGIPTTEGSVTTVVTVTDSLGESATVSLFGSVNSAAVPVVYVSGSFPKLVANQPIAPFSFVATGGTGPYVFSVASGTMPAGLTMDAAGRVTGTPTTVGAYTVTIRATDSLALAGDLYTTGDVEPTPESYTPPKEGSYPKRMGALYFQTNGNLQTSDIYHDSIDQTIGSWGGSGYSYRVNFVSGDTESGATSPVNVWYTNTSGQKKYSAEDDGPDWAVFKVEIRNNTSMTIVSTWWIKLYSSGSTTSSFVSYTPIS